MAKDLYLSEIGFDDFNNPSSETQVIMGRVFNILSHEEPKLKEFNVGLINNSADSKTGCFKIKLNLTNVTETALFEG